MKKVLAALLPMTLLACAPLPYAMGRYPGPHARVHPYPYRPAPAEAPAASVVGRWDNVMLLPVGTPVQVLTFDGRKPEGQLTWADAATLRLQTASGEYAVAVEDVMRVDRLPLPASRDYGKAAARGAAAGAGVVGVLGLLVGQMPPARVFAAGAVMGAGATVQDASYLRGPVMIYLAPPRQPQ
jgi:hypothetical protein